MFNVLIANQKFHYQVTYNMVVYLSQNSNKIKVNKKRFRLNIKDLYGDLKILLMERIAFFIKVTSLQKHGGKE